MRRRYVHFFQRLTPKVAKHCYLSQVKENGATEWFAEDDFCDYFEGPQAKETAYEHAFQWYYDVSRNDWVCHDYVFVAKPIWDAYAYVVDVGLTEIGEEALSAIQQGYVWDHPDLLDGTKGINIPETLSYWRDEIKAFHPDTPIRSEEVEKFRSIAKLPGLHELSADLNSALEAQAGGMFWNPKTREPDFDKSMYYWRLRITSIRTHDDPLFAQVATISKNPLMKPILADLTMHKMLLG